MQVLMMMIQLFQRTAISYGKLFMLMGTIIEEGGKVFATTVEVLGQEKYKHIKAHFKAAILHLIAAMSEFKKGCNALDVGLDENPEDFKALTEFKVKLKKDFSESLGECFKGLEDIMKSADLKAKVPAFIRESGEYMDLINQGCTEVDEKTFKELIVKETRDMPDIMVKELGEAQESIDVKGWAEYVVFGESDGKKIATHYILWADEFKFDDILPEGTSIVEEKKDLGYLVTDVKVNGKIYRVPMLRRMTTGQMDELRKDAAAFYAKLEKDMDRSADSVAEYTKSLLDEEGPEEPQA